MVSRYTPTLRVLRAECEALGAVPHDVWPLVTPKLEFEPALFRLPVKKLKDHLQKKGLDRLLGHPLLNVAPMNFYVAVVEGGAPPSALECVDFCTRLLDLGYAPIPLIRDTDAENYPALALQTLLRIVSSAGYEVDYRRRFDRHLPGTMIQPLDRMCSAVGKVTLLVDVGSISEQSFPMSVEDTFAPVRFIETIAYANDIDDFFDDVVVTSSSFPPALAKLPTYSVSRFRRSEHALEKLLLSRISGKNIIFGDRGPMRRGLKSGFVKPASLRGMLRYSEESNWVVIRGPRDAYRNISAYRHMARSIAELKSFRGSAFSFGDMRISSVAAGIGGFGTPQTWLRDAINQHTAFLVRRPNWGLQTEVLGTFSF